MAQDKCYKLGQYEIIEDGNGTLWWRSHSGLADMKQGRCRKEGNILVLGPSEIRQSGPLKREFMGHLKKLPRWDRTKYYCRSHSLYHCKTGAIIVLESESAEPRPSHRAFVSDATDVRRVGKKVLKKYYMTKITGKVKAIFEEAKEAFRRWSNRNPQ